MPFIAAPIIGGIIGAVGAGIAGSKQAGAAKNASQLQFQLGEDQLKQNQAQFNTTQANLAPFLKAGTSGINLLSSLLSNPGQGLLTPFTGQFQAPTAAQAQATPGYQFAAGAGTGAIQNSAAGSGNLLSTGTLKTLAQFNQGLASTTYSDTYNRAFNEYLQQYNQFQNNQTNEFNRLASISGLGQQTGTTLGSQANQASAIAGQAAANTGSQVGNSLLYGGAATASGYAGIANALTGGINNVSQYALLQQILNNQGGGGVPGLLPGSSAGYTPPSAIATPPFLPQVPS